MEVYQDNRRNKIVVTNIACDNNNTTIDLTIPSQLYPLSGAPEVFISSNTEDCYDQQLREIYDSTEAFIGMCYTNIENFTLNLKAAGIPKQRYKTYIGWLFPGNILPIHHAFIVIDKKYLMDFSVSKKYADLDHLENMKNYTNLSDNALRNKLVEEFMKESQQPHSQRSIFGKVPPNYIYVGAPCKPNQGKIIYNRLIRSHPNHPCIRNTTPIGTTDMQNRIIKKRFERNQGL